jgi:multicomponent Na+:H+ antiporter subunit D
MAAMVEAGHDWLWLALLFASAGVFHHAGIKIPYFAFFAHDSGLRTAEAPRSMLVAMGLAAAGCMLVGVFPNLLYALLPWQTDYVPYTYPHVIVQLQLLLFSALAFAWLQLSGIYPAELRSVNLDADWLYRHAARRAADTLHSALSAGGRALHRAARVANEPLVLLTGPRGLLAAPITTGTAALLAGLMLAGYLLLYYVVGGG